MCRRTVPAQHRGRGVGCALVGFRPAGSSAVEKPLTLDGLRRALPALVEPAVTLDVAARAAGLAAVAAPHAAAGRLHRDVAASLRYSAPLPAGRHVIEALYEGCDAAHAHQDAPAVAAARKNPAAVATLSDGAAPYPPFGPAVWKAEGTFDRNTCGDWVSRGYGRAGYVLFGFDRGADAVKLPPWCANVTVARHAYPSVQPLARHFHGLSADNVTFLQPPPGRRAVGGAAAGGRRGGHGPWQIGQ